LERLSRLVACTAEQKGAAAAAADAAAAAVASETQYSDANSRMPNQDVREQLPLLCLLRALGEMTHARLLWQISQEHGHPTANRFCPSPFAQGQLLSLLQTARK
jgi:rubrerythrin